MRGKTLIVVIDGCSEEYLSEESTPNILRMGAAGFKKTIKSAVPSVTNVNHASILSGSLPNRHGIVGNYYYERTTGREGFIESADHMKGETIFDWYRKSGKTTTLLTVKGKVSDVFGANADTVVNLQDPNDSLLRHLSLNAPPPVDSLETYDWIFNACYQVISGDAADLVYCTTNDYMMHNYAPSMPHAKAAMKTIDFWIKKIYDLNHSREIYITADHGMSQKSRLINLQKKLDAAGFDSYCLLPLKDRYLTNHKYQEGGAAYIYVKEQRDMPQIQTYLSQCEFIEAVYDKSATGDEFGLPKENIGDFFVLASREYAFAEITEDEAEIMVRTHGSLYEREIPLIAVNARNTADYYTENRDIVRAIMESAGVDAL
jgi:phosphonoacetate hydrolase